MALIQTIMPKAVNSHHSQVLSDPAANSVECLTIRVHLAKDSPNPANAPYLKKKKIKSYVSKVATSAVCGMLNVRSGRDCSFN
jgi:3-dehydroquinate dehydratase